jgi:hypothetical protein
MASSFAVEQPGLAQGGKPAGGPALDGAGSDPEQPRSLGLALVVEVTEHEHGALAGRQRGERSPHVECEVAVSGVGRPGGVREPADGDLTASAAPPCPQGKPHDNCGPLMSLSQQQGAAVVVPSGASRLVRRQ